MVACSLESKSIGDPADTSESSGSESPTSGEPTTGDPPTTMSSTSSTPTDTGVEPSMCEGNPLWGCTLPFEGGWPCGTSPYDDLDENCCPRVTCDGDQDCADGESCQPVASSGFGCSDFEEPDGELSCVCAANPTGGRRICVPNQGIDPNFCENHFEQESCEGASEIPYDDQHAYYCVWADVYSTFIEEAGTCSPEVNVEQRCVTATYNFMGGDAGCGVEQCSVGDTQIETGVARTLGDGNVEYISLTQYFCGSEQGLVGDEWIPCDDPSFGACACDCGE